MRCEHVQDRILEILMEGDAELPTGIQPHLDQCSQCTAEMQRLKRGIEASRLIPKLAVDPPKGMKDSVMAAIAGEATETAKPVPAPKETKKAEAPPGWSLGDLMRSLMVRPLPVAAAMAVLIIGTLGVYAGSRMAVVGKANETVVKVQDSPALANLDALQHAEWIQETAVHHNAVAEATLQLQTISGATDDPDAVTRAKAVLTGKRTVEALRALENAAPPTAEDDKRKIAEVRLLLEDILRQD